MNSWCCWSPRSRCRRAPPTSLRGPRVWWAWRDPAPAPRPITVSFRTYDPLRIEDHHCGWSDRCPPTQPLVVDLNNPLDPEQDLSLVTITPEVPGLSVAASGWQLTLTGKLEPRTRYQVTVPESLKDAFGQELGRDKSLRFDVGPAQQTFDASGGTLVVLDPNGGGTWPLFPTNHANLKATIHKVEPSDWAQWRTFRDRYRYDDDRSGRLPGQRVMDGITRIEDKPDEMVETPLDLSEHVNAGGYGQFVAVVQPSPQPRDRWERTYELAWVQVTRLGLHAFVDGDEVLTWVSDLATGAPLADVEVELLPSGITATTDADGLVRLPLEAQAMGLVARRGDDTALLPAQESR